MNIRNEKGMSRPAVLIIVVAILATLGILGEQYLTNPDQPILTSNNVSNSGNSNDMAAVAAAISAGHQSAPAPSQTVPTSDIKMGDSGDDVTLLQQFLTWKNILAPNSVTGSFGNATLNAVRTYQLVKAIPADGVVNAATRRAWAADVKGK